jgi:hypothetical protein
MTRLADVKSVLKLLESMAQTELCIGEFYHACSQADPANSEFWLELKLQEMNHAENIRKMIEIVSRKPGHFEQGRPFNISAVETFRKGVASNREKVQSGEIQKEKLLFLAGDIERSLLEQRFHEVLRTADIEYQTLVRELVEETKDHRKQVETKIAEAREKSG